MAPRRHYARGTVPAPPPEVPERAGPSEVQELRAQMAVLIGVIQRQGSQIDRLQELLERQVAAAAVTVAEGRGPLVPSARAPNAPEGASILVAPAAAHPLPASVPLAASGSTILDAAAGEVTWEREALKKSRGEKRPGGDSEGQPSSKKPRGVGKGGPLARNLSAAAVSSSSCCRQLQQQLLQAEQLQAAAAAAAAAGSSCSSSTWLLLQAEQLQAAAAAISCCKLSCRACGTVWRAGGGRAAGRFTGGAKRPGYAAHVEEPAAVGDVTAVETRTQVRGVTQHA
uniref:Uncharacterized protein n=1 Tax=Ananas comosus var. bracteatus TaxID=296719 RepID=A0A6V7QLN5_ANACO|nr:unnamed protein product [Ananas comosus var. bracteatus]